MIQHSTTDRFPHYPENVPAALKVGDVWVTCDEYKVPLLALPNGVVFAASSTDSNTWRSYETALSTWQKNEHIAGVGRVIAEDEDLVGVDLDDCVDSASGELSPWASTIVERLDSYAEISPSLTGVKIWTRAPEVTTTYKKPRLEIYARSRYFTVTGLVIGSSREIREADVELATIIEEEFPKVSRDRTPYDGPDRVLDLEDFLDRTDVAIFDVASDGAAERKYRIRCPWLDEHSHADETGTYTGQYENGALFFACHHAHCGRRTWRTFRHHVETVALLGRAPRGTGRLR
jgi:hypothetical protein